MSEEATNITEAIKLTEKRFTNIAPQSMAYEAEEGFAVQILKNNPSLLQVAKECPTSMQQALTNVAAIGLSLNPAKKQAYLLSRNVATGEKKNGYPVKQSRIFLEPSYMGMCDLATSLGIVQWIQARCVYEKDTYVDNGVGEKPTHTHDPFCGDRGEMVGVFCTAKVNDTDYLTTTMDIAKVHDIRGRSEAYKAFLNKKGKGGPWVSDFEEMAKKSVIRNAFKMWPKSKESSRMEEAIHLSNENEGFEPITNNPNLGEYTADQKGFFDTLIEKSDSLGLYVFLNTVDEAIKVSLFNSFEKGSITKYKDLVRTMESKGLSQLVDYQASLEEYASSCSVEGARELLEELSDDVINFILESATEDVSALIREVNQA